MKEQVLSIEQMQELIDMGIDTSKASMCWLLDGDYPYLEVNERFNPEYIIPTFTLQDILTYLEKIKPILTRDDDSIWFMEVHNLERDSIMYCEGCESNSPLETAFKTLKYCKQNNYI